MQCENCGEREAVIHLTQIVDNSVTTTHLCEPCAAEKGVETGASVAKFPLGDFLASLGKGGSAGEPSEAGLDVPCPSCGATLRDFRQTGRLGCSVCYDAFETHLRDLLRRLHGSTHHEGEAYRPLGAGAPASGAAPRTSPLEELKAKLKRAVETENFELAAELRDRIRVLE
ncbi:MAG: UvrB/UvrC motif-containing protein [Gemmatimonadales bacterium]